MGWSFVENPSLETIPAWVRQFIRFGLVGVLNTLVDASFYFLLSRSGLIPSLILAKGVSYTVGMLNSFYWNKSWTFQSHVKSRRVFLPFVVANLLAVGLNAGVMHLALNTFGLPESGALVLATVASFVWNFAISKFFIFK
jgi:putative flippase GtrA